MIPPLEFVYFVYLVCLVRENARKREPVVSSPMRNATIAPGTQAGSGRQAIKKAQRGSLRLSGLRESMRGQLFFQGPPEIMTLSSPSPLMEEPFDGLRAVSLTNGIEVRVNNAFPLTALSAISLSLEGRGLG